jgi:hypothetical protein
MADWFFPASPERAFGSFVRLWYLIGESFFEDLPFLTRE